MRKTVIITASIGGGHNQVAYALKEALLDHSLDQEVTIIDLLEEKLFYQMANSVYIKTITRMPRVFSKAYDLTQDLQHGTNVISLFNHHCYRFLQNIKLRLNPDQFLFTHPFPTAAYKSSIGTPAYAVITDFGYHSFWFNRDLTGYFIARPEQELALVSRGIPANRIKLTGIPIRSDFITDLNCLHKTPEVHDKPQVLLMGGGLGIGPMLKLVKAIIDVDILAQFVVVAGSNRVLHMEVANRIRDLTNWKVYGFTHEIPRLMSSSTMLITKAGAVTLSEASASGLPTLILNPLPGHEIENTDVAVHEGWAVSVNTIGKTVHALCELLSKSEQLSRMRDIAFCSSYPDASRTVVNYLETAEKKKPQKVIRKRPTF